MQTRQRGTVNWILMGVILITILALTGYDPVRNIVGKQNTGVAISIILIVAIVYSIVRERRGRRA